MYGLATLQILLLIGVIIQTKCFIKSGCISCFLTILSIFQNLPATNVRLYG